MKKRKRKRRGIAALLLAILIVGGVLLGVREPTPEPIVFEVADTLQDGRGTKARVILLGGQSNAAGCSRADALAENVSAEQYAAYEAGYDNVYINYYVSGGANVSQGFVPVALHQGQTYGFFGPELGMAETLSRAYPDTLFFIIKYAYGGTNLYQQWLSPSSLGKTGDLYREFVAYVDASLGYLQDKGYDVSLEGMCWMQGESDSITPVHAASYGAHLSNLIADVRERYDAYAAEGGIAFIDAYIADNPQYWIFHSIVNKQKLRVADSSDLNVVIDTNAQGLHCGEEPRDNPDLAHYDSLSQIALGHLFAEALAAYVC